MAIAMKIRENSKYTAQLREIRELMERLSGGDSDESLWYGGQGNGHHGGNSGHGKGKGGGKGQRID